MISVSDFIYRQWEDFWSRDNQTVFGKIITISKLHGLNILIKQIKVDTLLDVGCGKGNCLRFFREHGYRAVGIDASRAAVARCLKNGLPVFCQKLEEVSQSYDLVFSDGLLEHFLSFDFYSRQLMRISSRYILIIQPDHETFIMRLMLLLEYIFKRGVNIYEYNYRVSDYIQVFEDGGFQLLGTKGVFFCGFKLLLFQKKSDG